MKLSDRILWASAIVLVELVVFILPLMAFLTAYILIARPSWFKQWVDSVYR